LEHPGVEFSRDFQLILAGGFVSLVTTIVILLVVTVLIRMDRRDENQE
jgi:hypothetical protein